ncbi:MAG: hypothetical protein K2Y22_11145 [Candidatus Obscuribacterales bacterium]|nr:hypothetical protein [Candidatus Obscuribacterales bacterium]
MSKDEGKHLLDRLLSVAWHSENNASYSSSQIDDVRPYIEQKLWPGKNYLLAGLSHFSQYRIIGTHLETRRAGYLAVLCERGDRFHCVRVCDALMADGFEEILGEDELHWLASLPADTLIGPAYDSCGKRIPTAFAIWRTIEQDAPIHLEIARK